MKNERYNSTIVLKTLNRREIKKVKDMAMSEADTRAYLIDPKLKEAHWSDTQVTREYFYQRDVEYAPGRIILVGNSVRRGQSKRVDYLLRISESFPIAVVEAKGEGEQPEAGLEQAKRYARDLGLPFAYATNGHTIIEYDFFVNESRVRDTFPTPQELLDRYLRNTGLGELDKWSNPLLYPYCPEILCGKKPFYFQEVAIREVIKRFMRGQRRVLLTMATGTGKTFVAFQIVWKLVKSGWLQRMHPEKPARVLFLADRVVLRDQAYNAFAPFADGVNEPRAKIEGHPPNFRRDLYFGIYQALWSLNEKGRRLFECFPEDFFDLVIIDECHRSGFGTWKEILDRFSEAAHLGMTATPKQDENIDTYAYFCSEEEEVPIDPEHPEGGMWRLPAYRYSLGQGIEDGFLATYKVHRVLTTVDKDGLNLKEAEEQGAEIFIPEDVELREVYTTPQFEREITIPDRTRAMARHLAGLLRRFGKMEKTMVFCVDMEHARLVARLLQDEFGPETGFSDYAVPIIAEEGEEGRRWLESFADSEKKTPVVATTAELLSTGVDVPSCRNIVFMKTVSSPVLFKQIIGRGSRIDPATEKLWFRIIDYTGATRLLDEWDRPPLPPPELPQGPYTATLEGRVFSAEDELPIAGARVSVILGPNHQRGPILTDEEGKFCFKELPGGTFTLVVNASGFRERTLRVDTVVDGVVTLDVPLKRAGRGTQKIHVQGLTVAITDEAVFVIEATGEELTLERYLDYTWRRIIHAASTRRKLLEIWLDRTRRRAFLEDLRRASIHPEILAEVLQRTEADTFDLLSHLAFKSAIRTRGERATAFLSREQAFLNRYREEARRVILELLDKYRAGGIEQLEPEIFSVSPFREWGGVVKIQRHFGGSDGLGTALQEMRRRIYADVEEVLA